MVFAGRSTAVRTALPQRLRNIGAAQCQRSRCDDDETAHGSFGGAQDKEDVSPDTARQLYADAGQLRGTEQRKQRRDDLIDRLAVALDCPFPVHAMPSVGLEGIVWGGWWVGGIKIGRPPRHFAFGFNLLTLRRQMHGETK